jgi:t-SNARE complex subunit (syntaxin)
VYEKSAEQVHQPAISALANHTFNSSNCRLNNILTLIIIVIVIITIITYFIFAYVITWSIFTRLSL